jgi:hypothetical protein
MITDPTAQSAPAATDVAAAGDVRVGCVPVAFVVDEEFSIRHFLSLILHGAGIDTEEFADSETFCEVVARRNPDLVFLDIDLISRQP